jgi:hypothetical protein
MLKSPRRKERGREHDQSIEYPYVFYWNRLGRKGERCKVTARGKLNSCRVEFEDGFVVITSRNAVRKRSPMKLTTSK